MSGNVALLDFGISTAQAQSHCATLCSQLEKVTVGFVVTLHSKEAVGATLDAVRVQRLCHRTFSHAVLILELGYVSGMVCHD